MTPRRVPLASLSDQHIKDADGISVLDRDRPEFLRVAQLPYRGSRAAGAGPNVSHEANHLEIEIDSTDEAQLDAALARIRTIRGEQVTLSNHDRSPSEPPFGP